MATRTVRSTLARSANFSWVSPRSSRSLRTVAPTPLRRRSHNSTRWGSYSLGREGTYTRSGHDPPKVCSTKSTSAGEVSDSRLFGDRSPPSQRVRTLPIRVAPVPGEAMDSWLEALAARSHSSWGDLLRAVGLGDVAGDRSARARYPLMTPTSGAVDVLAAATGVPSLVLKSMAYDALYPGAADVSVGWRRQVLRGSRYCPACLDQNGGRWPLWWRLRWAFACPIHHCLLVDLCPHCQRPPRSRALPADVIPTPGRCMLPASAARGRSSRRCGADLVGAEVVALPKQHPALRAQDEILAVVSAGSASTGIYQGRPVPVTQYFRDLTAIGMRALRYGSNDELRAATGCLENTDPLADASELTVVDPAQPRNRSRESAAHTAVAMCAAVPVLSASSVPAAGDRLRWLIASARLRGLAVSATNIGWGSAVSPIVTSVQLSALAPFLGQVDQVRYRCFSDRPRRPTASPPVVHRSLPAMLWHPWVLPVHDTLVGFEQLRTALSVAVILADGHRRLFNACRFAGNVTTPSAVSRVLQALAMRSDWQATTAFLAALADYLTENPAPIDYPRRRSLPTRNLLPATQWRSICRDVDMSPGHGVRIRLIRCWLYERITGSPGRLSTHAPKTGEFRAKLADLPRTMFPDLVVALDDVARHFLDDHGRACEPLRWSPPEDAVPGWLARRPLDTVIDVERLRDLVRPRDSLLGAVASRLDAPIELVREVLNDHPAERPGGASTHRRVIGAALQTARARLSKDELADLYVRQRLPRQEIGMRVGVSGHTVQQLVREYGITLPP